MRLIPSRALPTISMIPSSTENSIDSSAGRSLQGDDLRRPIQPAHGQQTLEPQGSSAHPEVPADAPVFSGQPAVRLVTESSTRPFFSSPTPSWDIYAAYQSVGAQPPSGPGHRLIAAVVRWAEQLMSARLSSAPVSLSTVKLGAKLFPFLSSDTRRSVVRAGIGQPLQDVIEVLEALGPQITRKLLERTDCVDLVNAAIRFPATSISELIKALAPVIQAVSSLEYGLGLMVMKAALACVYLARRESNSSDAILPFDDAEKAKAVLDEALSLVTPHLDLVSDQECKLILDSIKELFHIAQQKEMRLDHLALSNLSARSIATLAQRDGISDDLSLGVLGIAWEIAKDKETTETLRGFLCAPGVFLDGGNPAWIDFSDNHDYGYGFADSENARAIQWDLPAHILRTPSDFQWHVRIHTCCQLVDFAFRLETRQAQRLALSGLDADKLTQLRSMEGHVYMPPGTAGRIVEFATNDLREIHTFNASEIPAALRERAGSIRLADPTEVDRLLNFVLPLQDPAVVTAVAACIGDMNSAQWERVMQSATAVMQQVEVEAGQNPEWQEIGTHLAVALASGMVRSVSGPPV